MHLKFRVTPYLFLAFFVIALASAAFADVAPPPLPQDYKARIDPKTKPRLQRQQHAINPELFRFPVACVLQENCWVSSYFDLDRSPGTVADYMCQSISTDNQTGIHIALRDYTMMRLNVPVIAAKDGRVVSISTNAPDLVIETDKLSQYRSAPCGNGVLIEHAGGWFTRYCHLRDNSIVVKPDDLVKRGQAIGAVGASGMTDWPKLDFSVSRNDYLFDPFSGKTTLQKCGGFNDPIWEQPLSYTPFAIMSSGFYSGKTPPTEREAKLGKLAFHNIVPEEVAHIDLWGMLMNVRPDDRLVLSITSPSGKILKRIDERLDFADDRYLVYLRVQRPRLGWLESGVYKGSVELYRTIDAEEYSVFRTNTVNILPRYYGED
jgi:murein DD-endopeptidase MepM/ murein hydrolase activator NlpD